MEQLRNKTEVFASDENINVTAVQHLRKSYQNLLKRVSEMTLEIDQLRSNEGNVVGERDSTSILNTRLKAELRQKQSELDEARILMNRLSESAERQARDTKRADLHREQIAVTVSNSICSGYIHFTATVQGFSSKKERRFACLSLSDIKIFDISMSRISHQIILKNYSMERTQSSSEHVFRFASETPNVTEFQFAISKLTGEDFKWIRAFNAEVDRRQGSRLELGPVLFQTFPEPMKELNSASDMSRSMGEDGTSTINGYDALENSIRKGSLKVGEVSRLGMLGADLNSYKTEISGASDIPDELL